MKVNSGRSGPVFLIGGAEDHHGECRILSEFVRLAGASEARLALLAIRPEHGGGGSAQALRRIGAPELRLVEIAGRADAVSRRALRAVEWATGVLITGSDHAAMTSIIGGTPLDGLLHSRRAEGLALAGSGAAASLLGPLMVVGGAGRVSPRAGGVQLYPGLEFLTGVVIDTHFSERCRQGRLLAAVAQCPHDLGIGIDEDTAVLVTGEQFEVLGRGSVAVYDAGACSYSNVHELESGEALSMHDLRVHVLSSGHRFHLGLKAPLIESPVVISRRAGHEL